MVSTSPHLFHIPVLGIGFSIDTPLKVAKYGISSVISLVDDELIEDMRAYHCQQNQITFTAIPKQEIDLRAKRITAYLNLLQELIEKQIESIKAAAFNTGSDLNQYFELLPPQHELKKTYHTFCKNPDSEQQLEAILRASIIPGSIDVNIMAKLDNARYDKAGKQMPEEFSDALSSLRGFAKSKLAASLIISAGYNPKLFNYITQFEDFFPNPNQELRKKIILKVSDYRSAMTQSKVLAKKGIWVSEFRIESGLNCGGHAFATQGLLLGPILEEFKNNRTLLQQELWEMCNKQLEADRKIIFSNLPQQKITVQGGIGTAAEQDLLLSYFQLDGTGWGSPFLLVPEATNVDEETLNKLANAQPNDFYLSDASPLGVPFHNFKNTKSEQQRKNRIDKGRPGSPCYKKYLSSNVEFTETVICTASRQYQNLKIKELNSQDLAPEVLQREIEKVTEKDCLCEGLGSAARTVNEIKHPHKLSAVAICPGPNTAFFSGIISLQKMVRHIYGLDCANNKLERPHMFINELKLYVEYLGKKVKECSQPFDEKIVKYYTKFKANLMEGIQYYKTQHPNIMEEFINRNMLTKLEIQLQKIAEI